MRLRLHARPYRTIVGACLLAIGLAGAPRARPCDRIGGCTGNAVRCAGPESVTAPSTTSNRLDQGNFTFELWMQASALHVRAGVFGKMDFRGVGLAMQVDTGNRIILRAKSADGFSSSIVSRPDAVDNQWHHIVVIRNGVELDLLIDGELEGSTALPAGGDLGNDAALNIGGAPSSLGLLSFTGVIDEFRLWNFPLDTALINCRRSLRLDGNEPGLAAYYPFDDSIGRTTSCDRSLQQNDATLGAGCSIVASTRTAPTLITAVEDSIVFSKAGTCRDTAMAALHLISQDVCGLIVRSITITGPDAPSFIFLDTIFAPMALGDTVALPIRCTLRNPLQYANAAIVVYGCPDTFFIPIQATRTGTPTISFERDSMPFGAQIVGTQTVDSLRVRNTGISSDTIICALAPGAFHLVTPNTLLVPAGGDVYIVCSFNPDSVGVYNATVLVTRPCVADVPIHLYARAFIPQPLNVCVDTLTLRGGAAGDLVITVGPNEILSTFDSLTVTLSYDARQIGILGTSCPCASLTMADTHDSAAVATLSITGCDPSIAGTLAALHVVALAPDSITTAMHLIAASTRLETIPDTCAAAITIIPHCDAPQAVYTSLQPSLSAAVPNPVSGTAYIPFTTNELSHVVITLYDALGRTVARVVDQYLVAGNHIAQVDADALHVMPGSYVATISAGSFHATNRMTVIR